MWNEKASTHAAGQSANPFSGSFESGKRDKADEGYGTPVPGSKTDLRGKAAHAHVGNEVKFLCEVIHEHGNPLEDGTAFITFKELFQVRFFFSSRSIHPRYVFPASFDLRLRCNASLRCRAMQCLT